MSRRIAVPLIASISARVGSWIAREREPLWHSVRATKGRREGRPYSSIEVDHRTNGAHGAAIQVTTLRRVLRRTHFGGAGIAINSATAPDDVDRNEYRGLYVIDRHDGNVGAVIAALSFHVPKDPRLPLELRTIAIRTDDLIDTSLLAATLMTAYIQVACRKLGRPCGLWAHPSAQDRELFGAVGFRLAHGPKHAGRQLWTQQPFSLFSGSAADEQPAAKVRRVRRRHARARP